MVSFCFFSSFHQQKIINKSGLAIIKITFRNNIKGSKIVFRDSTYTNPFNEKYTITKLRYYVTNLSVQKGPVSIKEENSYHLIDESIPESQTINFSVPAGEYDAINFLLGVDSLHNVSGAQTGDLDPTKDMFWTWNTGYVMAKLEGNSTSSKEVNNKFEFHIGGFSGPYNVLKQEHLNFPGNKSMNFSEDKTYEIIINADINTWWQNPHDIKISDHPVITTPGKNALAISDNYANMFRVEKIISQ
ncbi:MAG: MbnP family protein, partial [Ginsengibacter sp.]